MPALLYLQPVDDAAVDDQGGRAVVAFDGHFEPVTVLDAVIAGKAHHAADGVAEVEYCVLGAEQFRTGFLCLAFDGEADGVVIADLGVGQGGAGCHFSHLKHAAGFGADASAEIDAGSLAYIAAGAVEVRIGQGSLSSGPHLHGQGLQGGEEAVMDILDRDAVARMVVPYGEHAAEDGCVTLCEDSVPDMGRSPVLI